MTTGHGLKGDSGAIHNAGLSMRTFPDFEQFFAQVHGCACTLYFFGRHLPVVPGTAEQRAQHLGSAPDRSAKHSRAKS